MGSQSRCVLVLSKAQKQLSLQLRREKGLLRFNLFSTVFVRITVDHNASSSISTKQRRLFPRETGRFSCCSRQTSNRLQQWFEFVMCYILVYLTPPSFHPPPPPPPHLPLFLVKSHICNKNNTVIFFLVVWQ